MDDQLFSASADSSAKMWTITRGVELKSFKPFDDRVTFGSTYSGFEVLTMDKFWISYSSVDQRIFKIHSLPNFIVGLFSYETLTVFVTKSLTEVTLFSMSNETLSVANSSQFSIRALSSAYAQTPEFLLFGLLDGSIDIYSLSEKTVEISVSLL
jgi:hypothetical protein